jgi:hypothetical protein
MGNTCISGLLWGFLSKVPPSVRRPPVDAHTPSSSHEHGFSLYSLARGYHVCTTRPDKQHGDRKMKNCKIAVLFFSENKGRWFTKVNLKQTALTHTKVQIIIFFPNLKSPKNIQYLHNHPRFPKEH